MAQVTVRVNDKELVELRDRAEKISLSMSDYLRKKIGYEPIRRSAGRPGRPVECSECGEVVSISAFAKHMKKHD